jgi:hypothetical protein
MGAGRDQKRRGGRQKAAGIDIAESQDQVIVHPVVSLFS